MAMGAEEERRLNRRAAIRFRQAAGKYDCSERTSRSSEA